MNPTVLVLPLRKDCANRSGSYPSAATASSTRARIAGETSGCPDITRETLDRATPARAATSRMVMFPVNVSSSMALVSLSLTTIRYLVEWNRFQNFDTFPVKLRAQR